MQNCRENFFVKVQNKLHYETHKNTAPELIVERVNAKFIVAKKILPHALKRENLYNRNILIMWWTLWTNKT